MNYEILDFYSKLIKYVVFENIRLFWFLEPISLHPSDLIIKFYHLSLYH